jgi:hypothetical protein
VAMLEAESLTFQTKLGIGKERRNNGFGYVVNSIFHTAYNFFTLKKDKESKTKQIPWFSERQDFSMGVI